MAKLVVSTENCASMVRKLEILKREGHVFYKGMQEVVWTDCQTEMTLTPSAFGLVRFLAILTGNDFPPSITPNAFDMFLEQMRAIFSSDNRLKDWLREYNQSH